MKSRLQVEEVAACGAEGVEESQCVCRDGVEEHTGMMVDSSSSLNTSTFIITDRDHRLHLMRAEDKQRSQFSVYRLHHVQYKDQQGPQSSSDQRWSCGA